MEKVVWVSHPSHIINLKIYTLCILFCWLIVPIFVGMWYAYSIQKTTYTLTTERLKIQSGVLNLVTNEWELYRIRDYQLQKPFILRLFNLSTIILFSSDASDHMITINAVPKGDQLINTIRQLAENRRNGVSTNTALLDFMNVN